MSKGRMGERHGLIHKFRQGRWQGGRRRILPEQGKKLNISLWPGDRGKGKTAKEKPKTRRLLNDAQAYVPVNGDVPHHAMLADFGAPRL